MSRLIDADDLKERWTIASPEPYNTDASEVLNSIDEMVTAYDIDKVVEQLEKLEKEHPYKVIGQPDTYSQYNEAWQDCMDRVLGIVKRGGVK